MPKYLSIGKPNYFSAIEKNPLKAGWCNVMQGGARSAAAQADFALGLARLDVGQRRRFDVHGAGERSLADAKFDAAFFDALAYGFHAPHCAGNRIRNAY